MENCNQEVFDKGISLGFFPEMSKEDAEIYCENKTKETGMKHDWHYVGGRVHIKYLPKDPEPRFFNIKGKVPEEGQDVVYYFDVFKKLYVGKYEACTEPEYGTHCFFGRHGFLTDDVVWWLPVVI